MEIGKHLILDIKTNDSSKLTCTGICERYLTYVVDLIEMTEIQAAKAFSFPYSSEYIRFVEKLEKAGVKHYLVDEAIKQIEIKRSKDSGVTGDVILAESHITIHTYPEMNKIYIDIFSCKEFEEEKVLNFTYHYFNCNKIKTTVVPRDTDNIVEIKQYYY